jgi:hypothetical protein
VRSHGREPAMLIHAGKRARNTDKPVLSLRFGRNASSITTMGIAAR